MKKVINRTSSECLSEFLEFVRATRANVVDAENHIAELDGATGDWKHQIELGPYCERAKAATQLSHVLKERRKYKDIYDVNKQLSDYFATSEFTVVYRKLEQILGAVRKQEKYVIQDRRYNPRTVKSLPISSNIHNEEK